MVPKSYRAGAAVRLETIMDPQTVKDLFALRFLPVGWDGYEASPPQEPALTRAYWFLWTLWDAGLWPDRIAPSAEGGVAFSWRGNGKNANIEFFNSGEVFTATRDSNGFPVVEKVDDWKDALKILSCYLRGDDESRRPAEDIE